MDGKLIANIAQSTFGTRNPTKEQLTYIITMLKPSSYILKHHSIQGNPITFNISNRDQQKAVQHRPWQNSILRDQHPNKVVIKSRQLGLVV